MCYIILNWCCWWWCFIMIFQLNIEFIIFIIEKLVLESKLYIFVKSYENIYPFYNWNFSFLLRCYKYFLDKPKPPGMPNASEIANTSLTLSWKVPDSDGGSPITNYLIEYHDRNTLRWSTYNESFTINQPYSKGIIKILFIKITMC